MENSWKLLYVLGQVIEPSKFCIARLTFILGLILAAIPKSILKPFPRDILLS